MSDIRIHVLHCGTISVDKQVVYGSKSQNRLKFKAQVTPDRFRITLPNCAYLVESKDGLVLIDTGWTRRISPNGVADADAASEATTGFIWNIYHGQVGPGQAAIEKLEAMGIRPEDLTCVLFTNLEAERCSAIREFSGRTHLIVPQEESFYSYRHGLFHATYLYSDLDDLDQFYFVGTRVGPAWRSFDPFEDGVFEIVSTPGHSKGSIAVKIYNKKREFALLTSDTAFVRKNVDDLIVPGFYNVYNPSMEALKWMKEESENPKCKYVLAPHDPDIPEQIIEF